MSIGREVRQMLDKVAYAANLVSLGSTEVRLCTLIPIDAVSVNA